MCLPSSLTSQSYGELCLLLEAFKPKDIIPCTVVPEKYWKANHSMSYLFGHLYPEPPAFSHDQMMLRKINERPAEVKLPQIQKPITTPEVSSQRSTPSKTSPTPTKATSKRKPAGESQEAQEQNVSKRRPTNLSSQPAKGSTISDSETDEELDAVELRNAFRLEASDAALGNFGMHWSEIGLVSVSGHREKEEEL